MGCACVMCVSSHCYSHPGWRVSYTHGALTGAQIDRSMYQEAYATLMRCRQGLMLGRRVTPKSLCCLCEVH